MHVLLVVPLAVLSVSIQDSVYCRREPMPSAHREEEWVEGKVLQPGKENQERSVTDTGLP